MSEWLCFTVTCLKRNLNTCLLLILVILAIILYRFGGVKLELIALIFSPLFTLSILPMIEEYKAKWRTKYDTFKFLYSHRNNLIDYNVVQHLNLIDIVFINDKKVRRCWKELRNLLRTQATLNEQNAKCAELMATMANVLGLDKDVKFSDIVEAYYPNGLANIDEIVDKRTKYELEYYKKACKFLDKYSPNEENNVISN